MIELRLSEIAKKFNATLDYDANISEIVTDSRQAGPNKLFVALKGDRADGNNFVSSALEKGAEACIAERLVNKDDEKKVILTSDSKNAMIKLGKMVRDRFSIPFVGVTGSVGKTTTKEFIYCVLSSKFITHKNFENKNDEIGVPMTLFDLNENHEVAIIEMGMSNLGEIHELTTAVRPQVSVITWIGSSHLENLKTRENILKAKMEIIDGMEDNSTLVLCKDNDLLKNVKVDRLKLVFFGIDSDDCDIKAKNIRQVENRTEFTIVTKDGEYDTFIPIIGKHNVLDALAAFAVGLSFNIEPQKAADALKNYSTAGMRQKQLEIGDIKVIEDCYNCSPESLKAASLAFSEMNTMGRKILVVSDMLELGEDKEKLHYECGEYISQFKFNAAFAFGQLSMNTAKGANDSGYSNFICFETKQELIQALGKFVKPGDTLWFKASRGQRLEEVIEALFGKEVNK